MKKADTTICSYFKMIHITYIAQGLYKLTENIWNHFPRVDKSRTNQK